MKLERYQKELDFYKQIQTEVDELNKEKTALGENQKGLTKQNEDLKIKFSQLLDQF